MIRITEVSLDVINRALDEMYTNLTSRIKRLEKGTTLAGATGTFTVDGTKITVTDGIITRIGD